MWVVLVGRHYRSFRQLNLISFQSKAIKFAGNVLANGLTAVVGSAIVRFMILPITGASPSLAGHSLSCWLVHQAFDVRPAGPR